MRPMRSTPALPLALTAALAASAAFAQPAPAFREAPCPTDAPVPADRCGYVSVPERHAAPDGKRIEVFVAVKRATAPQKRADPVFYLEGGPGAPGSVSAGVLGTIFPDRDVVGLDQRGVGRSLPALACPEVNALTARDDLQSNAAISEAFTKALVGCGETLRKAGVDLAAYRASESALDVEFVRRALGYDRINLYGASYGTRLAQEVMRRAPASLRAVILDSVIPAAVDRVASTPAAIDASLRRVFAACAADAACRTKYPDLEGVYRETFEKLTRAPLRVDVKGTGGALNGQGLQGLVLGSLYFAPGVAELPGLIFAARDGRADVIAGSFGARFAGAVSDSLSWGAFYSHECPGEVAYATPANLETAYGRTPEWRAALGLVPGIASASIFEVCRAWGLSAPSANENDPVRSAVPTLLLAGEFDPVTPPGWLTLVAEGLTNARRAVLSGQSHGAGLTSLCGVSIGRAFLADPAKEPDAACASGGKVTFR